MANKRIKDLSTTAAVTASDDFIAVDGATNGTRKLDAYSPTFGGNLTVSGISTLNGTITTNGAKAVNVTPTMTPLSGNLYGLYVQPTINSGASAGGTVSGLTVAATNSGTSNVTNIAGIEFVGGNGAASGSMQDLKAFRSSPVNLSTGQIVNLYQFYATNAYNPSGTINTQYGLYVDALTSATTNYAIYTAGTAPSVLGGNLTVSGGTISSGTASLTLKSTASTVLLQSAGTTALTLDSSQNATFAGNVRLSGTTGTITLGSTNTGTFAVDTNGILTLTGGQSGAKLAVKHGSQGIVLDPIGGSAYVNSSTGNSILQVLTNAVGGTQSILQFAVSGQSTFDIRHDGANLLARDNTAGYYIWKSPQGLTSSTGYFQVLTTTPSSSTTTGALVVSGGVGVAGAVNVGGAISIGNTVQTAAAVASTHKVTVVIGGVTYYLLATNV